MKKLFLYTSLCFLGCYTAFAQKKPKKTTPPPAPISKKNLTHDVYDFWKDIPERIVSNNGQWFGYALNPQEGDGKVVFQHFVTNQTDSVARGGELRFSNDSEFAIFKIKPQLNATKAAKRAKKKKDEMPKDSLGIYALSTKKLSKFPAIQSFKLPEKGSEWVAF